MIDDLLLDRALAGDPEAVAEVRAILEAEREHYGDLQPA